MKNIKTFNELKNHNENKSDVDKNNYETEEIHIDRLRVGDTIIHNGEVMTVSGNYLKRNGFMGTTVFGDSYNSGRKLVTRITKPYRNI